jgi:uncharacterized protein
MAVEQYLSPLPNITTENRPFWDGLRERRFLVPRCNACGDYNWSPYPACRSCLSTDQEWVELSGRGTVYTFSNVYRGPATFPSPHVWAYIELEERPRVMTVLANIVNVDPDQVHIGMPVEVTYDDIPGHEMTLYRFQPRS